MDFDRSLELAEIKTGKQRRGNQRVMVDHEESAPAHGRRWY